MKTSGLRWNPKENQTIMFETSRHPIHRLLDRNCRGCESDNAKLIESVAEGWETQPEWQHIRPYSPEVNELLEKNSRSRPTQPIREGMYIGDSQSIEDYAFHYTEKGWWEHEGTDCHISILPNADRTDIGFLLQTFREIHEKIVTRGITGGKISVEIGNGQPIRGTTRLADAIACDHLIRFPIANNGCHLAAVCAAQGANLSLQAIILHEIGHLLEPKLSKQIGWLSRTLEKNLIRCQDALKEISPHYLGKQAITVAAVLSELEKIEAAGQKSIVIAGQTWEPCDYRNHLIDHFTHELAAEMIRDFYLEPALAGCLRTKTLSGWPEFDGLQTILRREARHTMDKTKVGVPVFPDTRRNPKPTICESIRDFMGR